MFYIQFDQPDFKWKHCRSRGGGEGLNIRKMSNEELSLNPASIQYHWDNAIVRLE